MCSQPSAPSDVSAGSKMGSKNGKPVLRKEDVALLVKSTGMKEQEVKQAFDNFLSRNPDGKLRLEEFKKLIGEARPDQDLSSVSAHCFRIFDRDNNGEIDFLEFMIANTLHTEEKTEDKMKKIFNLFDVNGDGKISMKEMETLIQDMLSYFKANKLMENLPADASEKFSKTIFSQMDKDKDGQISQGEFVRLCLADDHFRSLIMSFWPQNVNTCISKKK